MQKVKKNKVECCGCAACAEICPINIIEMRVDKEGFSYACFDEKLCINCGKCVKVCPSLEEKNLNNRHRSYAVKNGIAEERRKSTSGGVFPLLADEILKMGGSVAGVKLDEEYRVVHDIVSTRDEMEKFRNSKYVQSDMRGIYKKIESISKTQKVLFTGTPCQAEALRRYLLMSKEGNLDNMIICDLICGKTVSPGIWKKYIKFLSQYFNGNITKFIFRDKKAGWAYAKPLIDVDGKDVSKKAERKCNWMRLFTQSSFCRPACYQCKFSHPYHKTDITIGDFWGIENVIPSFFDNEGINLVITHSSKGEKLLNSLGEKAIIKETKLEDSLQDRLRFPTPKPKDRRAFWSDYYSMSFEMFLKKYASMTRLRVFIFSKILPLAKRLGLYNLLWRFTHREKKSEG